MTAQTLVYRPSLADGAECGSRINNGLLSKMYVNSMIILINTIYANSQYCLNSVEQHQAAT